MGKLKGLKSLQAASRAGKKMIEAVQDKKTEMLIVATTNNALAEVTLESIKAGKHVLVEKPEYDFLANTGMYLIKTSVIDLIPSDVKFDFPDLLTLAKKASRKVKIYPISQQSWIDIGQWQEYQGTLKKLEQHS